MTGVCSVLLPRQRGWQQAAWLAAVMCSQLLWLLASAQSCQRAQQCPFRVLAIGDSLSKGAVPSKQLNHPYSIRLQALLNKKFKNGARPVVTTAGKCTGLQRLRLRVAVRCNAMYVLAATDCVANQGWQLAASMSGGGANPIGG
eukprot:GHRQ01016457.1.p3 GENE.GHRQ01016457.1~~GHRQ01016457.1.p3  ORF type:complete len:144 (+),score=11.66 GHRQ01016457.1:410-841(+)